MRVVVSLLLVALLAGCSSFSFRPFAAVICSSACNFSLLAPAPAASAPTSE